MRKELKLSIAIISLLAIIFIIVEKDRIEKPQEEDTYVEKTKGDENMKIYLKINSEILTATLIPSSSSEAFIKKLEEKDITINLHDYGNFEKVGDLGFTLPRNDKEITTKPGDIILYLGNQITIYYEKNTWDFTKLGSIDNITQQELKNILGKGNVTVTFSLKNK